MGSHGSAAAEDPGLSTSVSMRADQIIRSRVPACRAFKAWNAEHAIHDSALVPLLAHHKVEKNGDRPR